MACSACFHIHLRTTCPGETSPNPPMSITPYFATIQLPSRGSPPVDCSSARAQAHNLNLEEWNSLRSFYPLGGKAGLWQLLLLVSHADVQIFTSAQDAGQRCLCPLTSSVRSQWILRQTDFPLSPFYFSWYLYSPFSLQSLFKRDVSFIPTVVEAGAFFFLDWRRDSIATARETVYW